MDPYLISEKTFNDGHFIETNWGRRVVINKETVIPGYYGIIAKTISMPFYGTIFPELAKS